MHNFAQQRADDKEGKSVARFHRESSDDRLRYSIKWSKVTSERMNNRKWVLLKWRKTCFFYMFHVSFSSSLFISFQHKSNENSELKKETRKERRFFFCMKWIRFMCRIFVLNCDCKRQKMRQKREKLSWEMRTECFFKTRCTHMMCSHVLLLNIASSGSLQGSWNLFSCCTTRCCYCCCYVSGHLLFSFVTFVKIY